MMDARIILGDKSYKIVPLALDYTAKTTAVFMILCHRFGKLIATPGSSKNFFSCTDRYIDGFEWSFQ